MVGSIEKAKLPGIIGIEIYFPREYVEQSDLEQYDGVSSGKYTIGLGQTRLAVTTDAEDTQSIMMTAVSRLVETSAVSYADVGFLAVGTETIIDKAKTIRSTLMKLFEESGNFDVRGAEHLNACFGGSAALFSAMDWIRSRSWDGRKAIVVCGDIATYAEGAARPTSGAGCVALLIGENAAIEIVHGSRVHHFQDVYDFYKPNFQSPYPVVDGQLSVECYMEAVMKCFESFKARQERNPDGTNKVCIKNALALLFHAPYCKIVQKAVTRMELLEHQYESNPNLPEAFK